jgi:hypothetical protein
MPASMFRRAASQRALSRTAGFLSSCLSSTSVFAAQTSRRCACQQGSDSIESWRTNLSFDPVTFEDSELGVQVHRGIYSAALALYPRFAAIVTEHLHTSPYARVSFTGHSLGGSIATVLALMLIHRRVLRAPQLGPIYTFGAAACFCEHREVQLADPLSHLMPAFEVRPAMSTIAHSVLGMIAPGGAVVRPSIRRDNYRDAFYGWPQPIEVRSKRGQKQVCFHSTRAHAWYLGHRGAC